MKHENLSGMIPGPVRLLRTVVAGFLLLACAIIGSANAQGTQQPVLTCTMDVPTIMADNANVAYRPMPIPVTVTNTGTVLANPVTARIIIPPLDSPILAPRCYVPDSLHFVDEENSYVPNPFTVRLTCVNNGNTPAKDVTGTLILPPNVELVNPSDSLSKHFSPATLEKWRISDPVPELNWVVRWVPRLRVQAMPEFRFTVTGKSFAGVRLDSTEVRCQTRIPGLLPLFTSCLRIPDSLGRTADSLDVEPNPFTARYVIWNHSHQTGSIKRVYISFPPDGLDLNPASPTPQNLFTDVGIAPGDSAVFEWTIDVANRITRRNVLIQVTALDDEGNPIQCEDWLPIASTVDPLGVPRIEGVCQSDAARLEFDKAQARYLPDSFTLSGSVWNTGTRDLHGVTVCIAWVNPLGDHLEELYLVELDTSSTGNERCRLHDLLQPGDSLHYLWKFRLKEWNSTWSMRYVRFTLEAGAAELPLTSIGNETRVEIAPSKILTTLDEPLPAGATLSTPYPNPFQRTTTVSFRLERAGPVTLIVTDALGREVRRLLDSSIQGPGEHKVEFHPGELTPGLYHCTLSDGEYSLHRSMLLIR